MYKKIVLLLILVFTLTACESKYGEAPVIAYNEEDGRIHITEDATFPDGDEIDFYQFCVLDTDKVKFCNWKMAISDSVAIDRPGEWYFYFKAVSKKGKDGPTSNVVRVEKTLQEIEDSKNKE